MIALQPGDRISEYILEEPLGRGAFGEVWRARHHIWDDRRVAVKIPTSVDAVRQLSNEGVIQASLDHPGIAKTLGMDTTGDPPYFITEYVQGRSLRDLLEERGSFAPDEALNVIQQVLVVLDYAHTHGVIHQDIKPGNILLTDQGEVKLTDFGLGQSTSGESLLLSASLRSDEAAGMSGTVPYIAPEIRDGATDLDGRVDLYSLGIVFFEMLTGKRPAGAEVPSELTPGLPTWADEIFRGLYTRRESRFPTAAAVTERLHKATATAKPKSAPRVVPVQPPSGEMLTEQQACARLGISREELRAYVRRGTLNEIRLGNETRFSANQLNRFQATFAPHRSASAQSGPGTGVPVPPHPRGVGRPAGFFIRAVAMFIDLVILSAISSSPGMFALAPTFVPTLLYFGLFTGLAGRTPGKMVMGLRVVGQNGKALNAFDGFVRTLNYVVSMLPAFGGFLVVPFSQRKLALHDFLCGTKVIHTR